MSDMHADDIVCLARAQNAAEAYIWHQALQDEGIRSKVVGEYLEAGFGDMGSVKPEVWVHKDDLARAEKILESVQRHPKK
jgi:hypothetical protein